MAEWESVQNAAAEHVRLRRISQLKQRLHKLTAVAEWASEQSAQAVHVRLAPDFAAEAAPIYRAQLQRRRSLSLPDLIHVAPVAAIEDKAFQCLFAEYGFQGVVNVFGHAVAAAADEDAGALFQPLLN